MTMELLRRRARAQNADELARAAHVDATELRRWLAGGINPRIAAAVKLVLESPE